MAELQSNLFPVSSKIIGSLSRADFKEGFMFGAATSAFQVEGAIDGYGRGDSIWDTFLRKTDPKLEQEYKTACDHYHKYEEDVEIMKEMNFDSYRFSISWPRLLPKGRYKNADGSLDLKKINRDGVQFYSNLIRKLKEKGIKPFVTLFHWDLPQALQAEYNGFLGDDKFLRDFRDYADLCFYLFGDEVGHWVTFNEPRMYVMRGYYNGDFAPGHKPSSSEDMTEYKVMHNLLRAHAEVTELYGKHPKGKAGNPEGKIGIVVQMTSPFPYKDNDPADNEAVQQMFHFELGWMLDPVLKGDYPETMKHNVKRLPKFTPEEIEKFKANPVDFVGLNYYTSCYVRPNYFGIGDDPVRGPHPEERIRTSFMRIRDRLPEYIGEQSAGAFWQYVVPQGIKKLLDYVKEHYDNPTVYITENGYADTKHASPFESIWDVKRTSFHYEHLSQIKKAIEEGINVKGYFVWALMDALEWADGSNSNFGLIHITKGKERFPKLSAAWFKNLLHTYY